MRIHAFLRPAFLLLAIAAPTLLRAQFQAPTDAELRMTDDPKAPGAAAVYLNLEEINDDLNHFHRFYARIKVLQEKGKELATIELNYLERNTQINSIDGRTIHADGTVIPLTVKPEDLLVAKAGEFKINKKVFTLPSVEVGSILEYRYQLNYLPNNQSGYESWPISSPMWEIQRKYFIHKAHFGFTPSGGFLLGTLNVSNMYMMDGRGNPLDALVWWSILPPGAAIKKDAIGRINLDLTDIPPIPEEEWMPPVQSILYKALFYYTSARKTDDYWLSESKQWSKEVDRFAEPSKAIREAVSGLIAAGDSDLDKAKKLYKAVQGLDNTDFSRAKGKEELKQLGFHSERHAEDTWSQKSGNSRDIALLYLAMLRAAGLTAYDVRVIPRDRGIFSPGYMYFGQLTDDIILLSTGGKNIPLDPGEKMCPFQTLHWKHSGATGVRQSPEERFSVTTPQQMYKANTVVRAGVVALDGQGAITGLFKFIMTGQEALRWRQTALRNDLDEVKKQFDHWLEPMVPAGVEAHIDQFEALDNPDADLVANIKAQGSLGTATSKRLMLPGFFFETRSDHPFVDQEKRLEPVDMHYGEQVSDQLVYHLPPGFAVEGAPQDTDVPWPGHAGLAARIKTEPAQITVIRQLIRGFTYAKSDEYQDLRGFYQKVAAADQQQLVLTHAPAEKGN